MDGSHPLSIDDWRAAHASTGSPRQSLLALQRRLELDSPPGVWISLVDRGGIESQLVDLEARAAALVDASLTHGALPLFGVPFAVKDNIDVAGLATTAACPAFRRTATAHSHAVERLVAAGAVYVGKTNLDQFATGLVGTRSPYGRPASTFDSDRISGGSSSGSAVVVSRGDVPFALGTDTAGSGRVPAAFNNIVGLKPTPGRVSKRGVVPACRSLDCVSVFALTAADAATVLALIEGDDPGDEYSAFSVGPGDWAPTLRLGVPVRPILDAGVGYAAAYARALDDARALGHEIVPVDFAGLHALGDKLYAGPWVAERHIVAETLLAQDPEAIDPVVRKVIGVGASLSASDAFRGLYALRVAQRELASIWHQVDALMVPSTPGHPRFAEIDAEPIATNARLGTYTNFVNLLGWCAAALPAGLTASGMPFGVTVIAPGGHDAALASFAVRWQRHVDLPLGATGVTLTGVRHGGSSERLPATEEQLAIAVVGAHLSGLPLNGQLTALGARLQAVTKTAPHYRLFALPATSPPKPGLVRVADGGAAIAVEVYVLPRSRVGELLARIASPLGLGSVELADGTRVHGFLCEAHAVAAATDISAYGGWRAYLANASSSSERAPSHDILA